MSASLIPDKVIPRVRMRTGKTEKEEERLTIHKIDVSGCIFRRFLRSYRCVLLRALPILRWWIRVVVSKN
jgi:hypothetical protein